MTVLRYIPSALLLLAAGLSLVPGLAVAQTKGSKAGAKSAAKSTTKAGATKQTKAAAAAKPTNPADARYSKSYQTKPTVERYMEIQKALHDRGYLDAPVDGKWGQDSVDALKRFQRDQSLEQDGKLGALSLVALGLGPKRGTSTAVAQTASGSAPTPQVE